MDQATIIGDICLAFSVIVGLFLTVGKPILKLNLSINSLEITIDNLKKEQNDLKSENVEENKKIWKHCDNQDKLIKDNSKLISQHDLDIAVIKKTCSIKSISK
jgi:hypothetical protein